MHRQVICNGCGIEVTNSLGVCPHCRAFLIQDIEAESRRPTRFAMSVILASAVLAALAFNTARLISLIGLS